MNLNPFKFLADLSFRYRDWPVLEDRYNAMFKYYIDTLKQNNSFSKKLSDAYEEIAKLKKEKEALRQVANSYQQSMIGQSETGLNL